MTGDGAGIERPASCLRSLLPAPPPPPSAAPQMVRASSAQPAVCAHSSPPPPSPARCRPADDAGVELPSQLVPISPATKRLQQAMQKSKLADGMGEPGHHHVVQHQKQRKAHP